MRAVARKFAVSVSVVSRAWRRYQETGQYIRRRGGGCSRSSSSRTATSAFVQGGTGGALPEPCCKMTSSRPQMCMCLLKRSKASACLLHTDPRSRYQVQLPPKLPGMHYSVDEQCQILFGTNATFCNDMEHLMCAGLWCLVEGDASCKTKLDPPLDGTECGADKWCRAGECVSKTPIPQHVDGDWSPWSQWSMCSRTCGTGVQFRQRKCDNPPPGPGGRHCQKASVEHKACEGPSCPKGTPSFRDLQCLSYNQHPSKKKGSMLTAVINDVGRDVPVLMADRVMDGTPCGPYEADLCVNGRCQKIGCDGIIGSSAKEDRCGVCNGDGRSCKIVRGDFNHTKGMDLDSKFFAVQTVLNQSGYNLDMPKKDLGCYIEAVVIPAGARRIKVVEDKPSHSFLGKLESSSASCKELSVSPHYS
ncbi:hypothetical protein L3Q82_000399 [Scortum barcoo]|uniref:Uncharacterized protein n=1 Tax=Scortum barcoo TaxID=214431 RepID=A0ACB8XAS3_9TELE|nr:hypothetical protein L3Q82_000399 [Scortum barcoo]